MIYLCFVKFYINFSVFYIAGHGSARRTIGPHVFWTELTQKPTHISCLGYQTGTLACVGTVR